jgi:16S rRNA (uracil1498-N3)-methyltransferase
VRLTRVHVELPLAVGATLDLPEQPARHLVHALRLEPGDACVLFNGDGHDYTAVISASEKRRLGVHITAREPRSSESPLAVTLVQALARGDKMDWILQKATELGVADVWPVASERSEVRLDGERAGKREAHWRGVLASACEQCGRARLPVLHAPVALAHALAALPASTARYCLDPAARHGLRDAALAPAQPVVIAIGPEGGWSARDLAELDAAGFHGLRLGPRVLRTETAGLAALSALQALAGDLG